MLKVGLTLVSLMVASGTLFFAPSASAQRQMETLDRGTVAIRQGDGKVFVSWRLLGTDPDGIAFNLYRAAAEGSAPAKLNARPLAGPTLFVDEKPDLEQANSYFVRPVVEGREGEPGGSFTLPAKSPERSYLSIPLQTPAGYSPGDASVGDLDGDGSYEIVLHQVGRSKDNSHRGRTDPPILQAYTLKGILLWTIHLGPNIREGPHYTQFLVYDFDGDGRAELVCKTADGTIDGKGKPIGDVAADHVNASGHVLAGPEFLTVFVGLTGAALATEKYVPARTNHHPEAPDLKEYEALWGDRYGNRGERYLAAVAYLDGKRPSIVMCRGYYGRTALAAWDWRNGKLTRRWLFDTGPNPKNPFYGQGNHNLTVTDVDADSRDEIIYGGMCVDDHGKGLWFTGLGHGDALHVGDLDPTRPGLEIFRIQERFADAGAHMLDARTGKVLWRNPSVTRAESGGDKGEGPGRGVAFDIDPRYPGAESWVLGAGIEGLWDARGNSIGSVKPAACNFGVWWDGDVLRELLDRNRIYKWNWTLHQSDLLLQAEGVHSVGGSKAAPSLAADILGDWREEILWPSDGGQEMRIYSTTVATDRRFYTFMHDPQYRLSIAWQNVGYNQPPHTSFHIGEGMPTPPRPAIHPTAPQPAVEHQSDPGCKHPGLDESRQ